MTTAKKSRAKRVRKIPVTAGDDIWGRTRMLVEILIGVMEAEIQQPDKERSEQWLRLFGAKDSAVVNLQKLVQLLAQLQDGGREPDQAEPVARVDDEEMAILTGWLRSQKPV